MAINTEKTKNMIIFFVSEMKNITAIKLQKAMLFADRMHWALYKKSISGLDYVKAQYGPVMERAGKKILKELDESVFTVIPIKDYCSKEDKYASKIRTTDAVPDMTMFSDEEISSLKYAYRIVRDNTDEQLVLMTHDEAWENTKINDIIPYETCVKDDIAEHSITLTDEEKKIAQEALKISDYSKLEDLAIKWI